jgi:hypothetical protein
MCEVFANFLSVHCMCVYSCLSALCFQIERHRDYQAKIDQTLRLLENEQVTPDEVENALKDGLVCTSYLDLLCMYNKRGVVRTVYRFIISNARKNTHQMHELCTCM